MTGLTINQFFYSFSGYTTATIQTSLLTGSLIPAAERLFKILIPTKSFTISDYSSASTGDVHDDIIVSHIASYHADNIYDKVRIDPETGRPVNRHWEVAYLLMLQSYGELNERGDLILPVHAAEEQAAIFAGRVDSAEVDWKDVTTTSIQFTTDSG